MIWVPTILALILGTFVAGSVHNVQADELFNLRAKNSTHGKPGNKTHLHSEVTPAIVDNIPYMKFACQGKQNGLRMPIEGSCTHFLECQKGSAKLMTCEAGKHFSTFALACIDVKLSNCSVKCECCGKKDGLYPDVSNCANFVVCLNEKAHRQSCGSVLKFNSEKLMCDIPQRARCSVLSNITLIERKIQTQGTKTPLYLISHRVCRNSSNGYTVGVRGSCNKFYLCVNGKGYLKSCGQMQFNFEEHYCDGRTRIYCPEENDIILESDEISDIPLPQLPQYGEENIEDLQPPHRVPGKPFPPQQQLSNENALHPPVVGKPEQSHLGSNSVPIPHLPEGFGKPQNLPNRPQNQGPHAIPPVVVVDPVPLPPSKKAPQPPVIRKPEQSHLGSNSVPIPHLPEGFRKPENLPNHPPNQGPHAISPVVVVDPVPLPPNVIVAPEIVDEIIDPKEYAGLCADQSVGALIAIKNHCNKYIRCRWDWFERRVAEVESCPKHKHFNPKSKLCDLPEKAGCAFH